MVYNAWDSTVVGHCCRSKAVCSNNVKRQGKEDGWLLGSERADETQITYDLDQLPPESWIPLRDSVLALLVAYASGPRPIRTQLCVCIASLAIQITEWKDVLATVGSTLGSNAGDCVLEFLRILPEEVTEGRKINLSVCSATTPSACGHTTSILGPLIKI